MKPTKLYRTTIVIWTEVHTDDWELDDIAREAISGEGFCSSSQCEEVSDAEQFPDTEFFDFDRTTWI